MSDREGEWPEEAGRYAGEAEAYAPVVSRSILPTHWLAAGTDRDWLDCR
jgi:hypothetical protein